ncbi:S8 family serine peptidase [Fictibacillus barbaricus]|uniref:S8 family serine peptidase n=1 Tax=Fictibacillus barbaricus TaxID=182136 RepID=A0ABS2Z9P5_9BACL|nr:S8 family serine peptidase [Fictibacillus barbaricus]MBN3543947.1 S8 family serine peptidase [Fictibacillus barbaricus]GGB69854.1 peptidase S8 [Fictibacillus barbaricus]
MKISKMYWFKKAVKGCTATAIFTTLLFPSYQVPPVSATDVSSQKSEDILRSLTSEQRNALKKLQVTENAGLQGFDKKDLESDEELTVIVEFKSKPAKVAVLEAAMDGKSLTIGQAKRNVDQEHSAFEEEIKRIVPTAKKQSSYKITRHFKTVYNGVSMKLAANEVEQLLQSDAVKAVYKSVPFTVKPPLDEDFAKEESTKRVESIPFLGVDKLHKEGITGKGVKVGVIDTGIDYTHPDLRDAYKGGYDLVDNDADPMETTYNDWKESGMPEFNGNLASYYTSHGTHVSGTIAGQSKNTGGVAVIGVAPEADVYGYRVLGPYGSGELEDILAGIEKAVEDGMDVINLSLGANINDPMYPTSTAVNYAVLQGVTAVVSAGNTGSNSYTLGTPGAAALALTVGASSTPIPVAKYSGVLKDSNKAFHLSNLYTDFVTDLSVFNNQTLEVVDLGVGKEIDYANKDVAGKVVFVNTGEIGTQSKTVYAKNHGARAIIAYNNRPNEGPTPFVKEDQNFIPAFSMSYEQGLELKAQIAAGHNLMTFKDFKEVYTEGDKLAAFSSRGPSRSNYDIKPELTAPGVSILSSVPAYAIYKNDPTNYQFAYSRMSGTSMAAPHAAGISALLLQANPELQPNDVKTILMNTAKPLAENYSVFEAGAGRVDPYRAVHAGMKLQVQDETPIPLNEKDVLIKEETGGLSFGNHYAGEQIVIEKSLTFSNMENTKKKFDVDVHFQTDIKGSLDAVANDVKVDVPQVIPVQSAKSKKVPVSITVPAAAKAGVYEGYINITNQENDDEHYRIPFSVRTTEEGFNSTSLSSYAISPPYLHVKRVYQATSNVSLNFNIKAPMKKIDLVLVDGKTGAEMGYIGMITTDNLYDRQTYNVQYAFEGTYFAFTGDQEQPLSFKKSYAKPGPYRLKIIGTSTRDRIFINYNDVYIDHNNSTIKTSLDEKESPVIEYQPGQKTVPLQVNVFDEEVEQMKEAGMDVNQAVNRINYSINGNFNPVLPLKEDGTIDLSVPMNEAIPFLRYTLNGLDAANNSTAKMNYYFVKAGTPYGYVMTEKTNVKMGDSVSATLVLNNVEMLKNAEWTLSNIGQSFEILEATPNEALADYGSSKVDIETNGSTSKVKLTMDRTKPVSGNIPAINLTLKVKDTAFSVSAAVNPTVSYMNESGNQIPLASAGIEWMIQPTFSEVYGTLRAEAIAYNADWRKVGASIRLINDNGTVYDGSSTLLPYGDYRISKLPITDKTFVWELSLPGHFKMKNEIPVGVEKKGIIWGQSLQFFNDLPVAGDVNQDDVIDILDALAIQKAWNTNDREADINFDGIVNTEDIQFVVKHYLKQNSDAENPPKPLEQAEGKTLEDILRELQIAA